MKKFEYKATKSGKLITGALDGKDEDEVASKLREKGYEVLSIVVTEEDEQAEGKFSNIHIPFLSRGGSVKKVEKVFLFKNFATMIKAGLPLPEAIDLLRDSIKSRKLKEILDGLKYDVESGGAISTSLNKHQDIFGTSEIAMINAGEVGGTLPQSFENLYEDAHSEHQLQKDLKSAMMYPIIVLSILILVVLLMVLFVLPQLTGFFTQANIDIPMSTKIVMWFSSFIRSYFIFIVIGLIASFMGLKVGLKRSKIVKTVYDRFMLKVPMVGKQLHSFYVYKIARMLGLLIRSGVPILEALEIVSKSTTHTKYKESIEVFRKDIKVGGKLYESVEKFPNLYPPFVSRMLRVGDRTGNTAESLQNISDFYRTELEETLANLSTLVEPILMVFLGAGIAVMAISILVPLYSIVSGINEMQK